MVLALRPQRLWPAVRLALAFLSLGLLAATEGKPSELCRLRMDSERATEDSFAFCYDAWLCERALGQPPDQRACWKLDRHTKELQSMPITPRPAAAPPGAGVPVDFALLARYHVSVPKDEVSAVVENVAGTLLAVSVAKQDVIYERSGKRLAKIRAWMIGGVGDNGWHCRDGPFWVGNSLFLCQGDGGMGTHCRLFTSRGKQLYEKRMYVYEKPMLWLPDVLMFAGEGTVQFVDSTGRLVRELSFAWFPVSREYDDPLRVAGSLDGSMYLFPGGDGHFIEYPRSGHPTCHSLPGFKADLEGAYVVVSGPPSDDEAAAEALLAKRLEGGLPRHGAYPKLMHSHQVEENPGPAERWSIVVASAPSVSAATYLAAHLPEGRVAFKDRKSSPLAPEPLRELLVESVSGLKKGDEIDWVLYLEASPSAPPRCVYGGATCFPAEEVATVRTKGAPKEILLPFAGEGSRAILTATMRTRETRADCVVRASAKDGAKEIALAWNITALPRVTVTCPRADK